MRWSQFVWHVHRVVQEAFSIPGTEPEVVAGFILQRLKTRGNSKASKEAFQEFIQERKIQSLIHFTRIENVAHIIRYGLIPRAHLELPAVRLALNPYFNDEKRNDKHREKKLPVDFFPKLQDVLS